MPRQPRPLTPKGVAIIVVSLIILGGLTFYRVVLPVLEEPVSSNMIVVTGPTMGTTFTVKFVVDTDEAGYEPRFSASVVSTLARVNDLMSTYLENSELSRFNASRSSEAFDLSYETFEVFRVALETSEVTDGAFDVTVGPLVNAWGFGPEIHAESPSDDEVSRLLKRIGYAKLELNAENSTIRKLQPDLYCDLSAIAKGYAVDELAELIEQSGQDFFVEIGGEIRASGESPDGPWEAGIEKPVPGERSVHRIIPLYNISLATSGDYRNFYELDGKRVSHTIDPRTGRPVQHALASVSVLHSSCTVADAYATAFAILGPDEGYALAEQLEMAVLFLVHAGDHAIEERMTPAFERYLAEHDALTPAKGYN